MILTSRSSLYVRLLLTLQCKFTETNTDVSIEINKQKHPVKPHIMHFFVDAN